MRSLIANLRACWRGLRRPAQIDADMNDEMRFHIEMEAQRLQQGGLSADEAQRQAAIAFGGIEKYRGAGRDAFGFTWMRGLSVDLKLGMRMLRKYPGLTAVAVFALSLAIGAGAGYLEFINDLMHGKLPFPEADRIVGIVTWDQESGDPDARQTANFVAWRRSLRSIDELAAYRALDRNLITSDGRAEPVRGVEISASAFRIAQVPPVLGRPLLDEDERAGAPPVVVIGYNVWATRFASDPDVVGKTVRLGRATHTIVGVMPPNFGLPVSHSLWLPLALNDAAYPRRDGPPTKIFGRLATGMTISAAQAELTALGERAAADFPATDRHLRPVVKPYVESLWSAVEDSAMQTTVLYAANVLFLGLLGLCGANIATLVFARTATRDVEISVRTALGASRARIAGQLFAEALVLSSIAAIVGLTMASYALIWVKGTVAAGMGSMMFWWNDRLEPATVGYAALLALFAAFIVGVVPALKATNARVQDRLKQATGATSGGIKFGGVWTGVIVTQVAVTVIFLAIVGMLGWSAYVTNGGKRERNFPESEYVALRVSVDRVAEPGQSAEQIEARLRDQVRATHAQIARQLAADPTVTAVTYGSRLPGMNFRAMRIDVDGMPAAAADGAPYIRWAGVGLNYLDTFQAPLIRGRGFTESDIAVGRSVAIVDRTFARTVFNGQDAVGRHVREAAADGKEAGPWIEIVGVVGDLTNDRNKTIGDSMLFRPAAAEDVYPLYLAVHARGNPAALIPRVQKIGAEVDPTMRMTEIMTMDNMSEADRVALDFFARLMAGVSIVAMILATAGVYALMSFTVARRTSEIGIRVALGANPRRIVIDTFARAFMQVTIGLVLGSIPAALIVSALGPEVGGSAATEVAIGIGIASTMLVAVVTAIACVFPARRALTIQPTDALKTT
ncbi:MAG TPA: ABC transporter permease [Vicinamibacterales bacterium]|nr:ABC transporter permease [Vicinamibacterales bacterium]